MSERRDRTGPRGRTRPPPPDLKRFFESLRSGAACQGPGRRGPHWLDDVGTVSRRDVGLSDAACNGRGYEQAAVNPPVLRSLTGGRVWTPDLSGGHRALP